MVQACDVLVIGSGIAGVVAAIEAGRGGARVVLASKGRLFSGSSFYPGTWGLGLIAPADVSDERDLADTILEVGCGVADPELVRTFVGDLLPSLDWLDALGVELQRPSSGAAGQRAFIPCFDHKHRTWRGITREPAERAFARELERLGVARLEGYELIDLVDAVPALPADAPVRTRMRRPSEAPIGESGPDRRIRGAVLADARTGACARVACGAVVLACGGTSGLFARRLTSADVMGSAHGTALRHGCSLINIEFMQMMPGLVSPISGVVFNEKTFRYARPAEPLASTADEERRLLELRSGHGPFTARLASKAVDQAIDRAGDAGWRMRYRFPEHDVPEFVESFASWLELERGVPRDAPMSLAMYAHASNGGVRIDADGWTGIEGLYACGEVTGGMHGADRIGGLSSANGIVFGRRAGAAASRHALAHAGSQAPGLDPWEPLAERPLAVSPAAAQAASRDLAAVLQGAAMINRTDTGLSDALERVARIRAEVEERSRIAEDRGLRTETPGIVRRERILNQLLLAESMLVAMRARPESRGAHNRADAPAQDPALAAASLTWLDRA